MTTLEDRVTSVEQAIGLLTLLAERQQEYLEEIRRDNRQTRRIWIAIARKQELFDEDEFNDVFGE
jgi:hypothetical protein